MFEHVELAEVMSLVLRRNLGLIFDAQQSVILRIRTNSEYLAVQSAYSLS